MAPLKQKKMTKILILDNYDSFTYNLVQLVEEITHKKVAVFRNDEITLEAVEKYDKIILSPGPGIPSEAGIMLQLIKRFASTKSLLGVCLGHQAIAQSFGAGLIHLKQNYHGVATNAIKIKQNAPLLKNLPDTLEVGRYHSWAVNAQDFPAELEITAIDENGMIMSLQHIAYDVHGVQYHPESILTPAGRTIIENFIQMG